MLGVHWIADVSGCRASRVTLASIRDALIELPAQLHLTRVGDPQVFEHRTASDASGSLAGIVLIAESHVSMHGFPDEGAVHVDIFSCKAIDLTLARSFVIEHFCAEELVEKVIERGRDATHRVMPTSSVRRAR